MRRTAPDRAARPDPAPADSAARRVPDDAGDIKASPAPTLLVEHYWPGVTEEAFRASVARVRAAVERLSGDGETIRYLHSTFVPADESALCVFEASSVRLLRRAYSRAGVRFERMVVAVEIGLDEHPLSGDRLAQPARRLARART